ncbi:hypothetical protein E3V36_00330 [Candidatus Marinimicrobia bacterium MT.SAG.2]|nr:hypothetical protein E3V36_00330 [Candidatus Marinimicrobia bacterium MT.SAG.2]
MYGKMRVLLTLLALPAALYAQDIAISEQRTLINRPTAGSLERGSYDIELRMYPGGGLLGGIAVGLTERITFGTSFGGLNIIGEGPVIWNPRPEANIKYRLMEESYSAPALSIGFNGQGFGSWSDSLSRYQIKSPGVYAALSKNYSMIGNLGFHAGVNLSLENADGDEDINLWIGFDKSINEEISFLGEYDFALNDNSSKSLGSGDGYLNAALRWAFVEELIIELNVNNLLGNREDSDASSRELKIIYVEFF